MNFINKEFLDACKSGNLSRVKDLFTSSTKANINIDTVDDKGKAGFIHAVESKNREIASFLIEQECEVNVKDNEGKTALHYAANNEDKQMVLFLLMNGADSSITD